MNRRVALVLLVVLGTGVFLAGLELMNTAVALPAIIADLGSWTELRHASWIVNAYLLVYVGTMPLAGRLVDLWGARRLFLAALGFFTLGSLLAGMAQSLDQLIAARAVQALGGGALVPVATAAASHLFEGHERPRALGVIGALTFLGMAAGPLLGAAIIGAVRPEAVLAQVSLPGGPAADFLAPAWRYVFYVNVPIGIAALAVGWAATVGWETPRAAARVDALGALLFTAALGAVLLGVTLLGEGAGGAGGAGLDPATVSASLIALGVGAGIAAIVLGMRRRDPFLDPRLFLDRVFTSAALVSLLTGYALATAIVGSAVFVDRVLYGGPDDQRLALGALAGATAVGALVSGWLVRRRSLRALTAVGLASSISGLLWMSTWDAQVTYPVVAGAAGLFGLGFGLTVTPRSTAAMEAVGRTRFGAASATVTVARMIGMAVGLAVLTAYGSTTIDRLSDEVFGSPDAYREIVPPALAERSLRDPLVVDALETWAAAKASETMVGVFLVAAGVTAVALPAGLALGARPRMLRDEMAGGSAAAAGGGDGDGAGLDDAEPTLTL
ncbi:MAG TPA: MFS transporter [Patescibacteria group bacterium]|nr:MFS transporter [Patescibacteria group bacterium]